MASRGHASGERGSRAKEQRWKKSFLKSGSHFWQKITAGDSRIIIGESEVFDQREAEETLVAKALVTLMVVHRE